MSEVQTRVCPTRIDGQPVLVAQRVPESRCLDRQRGLYHKCYTCALSAAHEPGRAARPPAAAPAAPTRATPRVKAG